VLARLPASLSERRDFIPAIALDLARLATLLGVVAWLGDGGVAALAVAGLAYATTPIVVTYNCQLNPRGMGALLLDWAVVLAIWERMGGPSWIWAAVGVLSALILLTHKMTTQAFWWLCLGGAVMAADWRLAALVPGSAAAAWLVSGGFYGKVLRAHADIVRFWNRNWRWLFGHPIRDSPIYGDARGSSGRLHAPGPAGVARRLLSLVGFAPAAWLALASWLVGGTAGRGGSPRAWCAAWLALVLGLVLGTTFVARLKAFGAGYLYLYNAAFPAALLLGLAWSGGAAGRLQWATAVAAVVAGLAGVVLFARRAARAASPRADEDWPALLEHLERSPPGAVLCVPFRLSDAIAFQARLPVVWGGHGYGFRELEPVFPRLLIPLGEAIRRWEIRYVLIEDRDLPDSFNRELAGVPCRDFGRYRLFTLDPVATREAAADAGRAL
jgi:hypothetical protein